MTIGENIEDLLHRFREAFRADPKAAYREWYGFQEELTDAEDAPTARALADDLWAQVPELKFPSDLDRARFQHNLGVFFGTEGPAADLSRARTAFEAALEYFSVHDEGGWRARTLHNFATALSNLGQSRAELQESVALFEAALAWRNEERAVARGVTRHNMGIVWRRLAKKDPAHATEHLEASASSLREAIGIRETHGLSEGRALSLFHLGLTLEAAGRDSDARASFESAASELDRLGKTESATISRNQIRRSE